MKPGDEAVAKLLDLLNAQEIDYMVVGSFSSNRYGIPRATKDADIVLHLQKAERERLPEGFEIDSQGSFEMVTATSRQILKLPSIPFTIELFDLSADSHDQSRFSRRQKLTLLDREAWLPTAEDVVIQKLRWSKNARRGRDFDDVVAVLSVQGQHAFDWPYIEKWCAEHDSLGILEEAKAEAAPIWEADETG